MITWPLFSPPRPAPETSIAARMCLSPTGRPDDAARPPPRSRPGARRSRAPTRRGCRGRARPAPGARARGCRGPGRRRRACPRASTATHRSASPSSANPTSAPRLATASASDAGAVAPQARLMLSPSGASWITVTRAPGRAQDLAARRGTRPRSPCRGRRAGRRVDRRRERRAGGRRSARGAPPASTRPPDRVRAARPAARRRAASSASSSSSTSSSSFRPRRVEHLEPVVLGRVVRRRDHDPGGERRRSPARNASAGVGTTPTEWTSAPMLVAPAVIAATNMSPERRVSWPTTSEPPAPTTWWAVARPSANASDGRDRRWRRRGCRPCRTSGSSGSSREGSVRPGRGPATGRRRRRGRPGSGRRPAPPAPGVAGTAIVTVTVSGDTSTRVTVEGNDGTTGSSWLPGASPATLTPTTIGADPRRSRSATGPNRVSSTCGRRDVVVERRARGRRAGCPAE